MFNPVRGWSVFVCFPRLRRGLFKLNPCGVFGKWNIMKRCGYIFQSYRINIHCSTESEVLKRAAFRVGVFFVCFPRLRRGLFKLNPCGVFGKWNIMKRCGYIFQSYRINIHCSTESEVFKRAAFRVGVFFVCFPQMRWWLFILNPAGFCI
jgi:hypothetical protein